MADQPVIRSTWVLAGSLALVALLTLAAFSLLMERASANPATGFAQVSAGANRTCGVTTGGAVECWGASYGSSTAAVSGLSSGVTAVSVGGAFACALTDAGGVKCWGVNGDGELGRGTSGGEFPTPATVSGLTSGVSAISAGTYHACAALVSGGVKCWGFNVSGQLGNGTNTTTGCYCIPAPVDVVNLGGSATSVAAGAMHTCAVLDTGAVKCWGNNPFGGLGNGSTGWSYSPVSVSGLSSGVATIAAGADYTCAVTTAGAAKCWGYNQGGQLGDGTQTNRLIPVDVTGLSQSVSSVSAHLHTCALAVDGSVSCWGNGSSSAVGVSGLSSGVSGVDVGSQYTCALMTDSGVKCWGLNNYGQLGDGTTTNRSTPVAVNFAKPTPCPTDGCPTATPTPLVCASSDCATFHEGIDVNGDNVDDCDTAGGSSTCTAALHATIKLKVYLDSAAVAFAGMNVRVDYDGVTLPDVPDSVWPGCVFESGYHGDPTEAACIIDSNGSPVSYTGLVVAIDFQCSADGNATLLHGTMGSVAGDTNLFDRLQPWPPNYYVEGEGTSESLAIQCVDPAAYPMDSDGDGCPDMNEALPSPYVGGQRNFFNTYDYFNPTHDGLNRIDDVLVVVDQYFVDQGNPAYTADTDRRYLGPNVWDLGAPNGKQRVDDIVNELHQYFHDCS